MVAKLSKKNEMPECTMPNADVTEYEDATPPPADLIKSIAEQGYTLQASLADLIDNSISAKADRVELLIDTAKEPFKLFLGDNGEGMSEKNLKLAMKLPSQSPDSTRKVDDLGRFGLGLKTASFSQTRKFTVISRKKGSTKYSARTWDLKVLEEGFWRIVVNSESEINEFLLDYHKLSADFYDQFDQFQPNTIIVWQGLHKFEEFISSVGRESALRKALIEVTADHLSIVFHRFMERKSPLKIRLNNNQLVPFNPFPTNLKDLRPIESKSRAFNDDNIKIEGFVLPARAIAESRSEKSDWTTRHLGLIDMEGVYIYRTDRLISFGGWNAIVKKSPRLQLARLRVDIGNQVDLHLHLNVAKSHVNIPSELRLGFKSYIDELQIEAEREYYNKGLKRFKNRKDEKYSLWSLEPSNKGLTFAVNKEFPLLEKLYENLPAGKVTILNTILRLLITKLNFVRKAAEPEPFGITTNNVALSEQDLLKVLEGLTQAGISIEVIKRDFIPELGYEIETLPQAILDLLE
jgi:hypothetical protein